MKNKIVWIWILGGIGLLLSPQFAMADDDSLRVADLESSLASIEREAAVVAKTDNADAKILLAEVRRNITLTLADGRDDRPADREFVRRVPQRLNVRLQAQPGHPSGKRKAESGVERNHESRQPAPGNAQKRLGAAIGELRKDVDQLRKEMDAIKQLFRKYHDIHGKTNPAAKPAAVDLDATLRKLVAVQESLDQFYRSETIQLHAEAVRRDIETKRQEMDNRHHEMRERMEEQQSVSRRRIEAVQRETEVRRRAMEAKRYMAEQQAKAAHGMAAKARATHEKAVNAKAAAAKRKMEESKKRREITQKKRAAEKEKKRGKKEHDKT